MELFENLPENSQKSTEKATSAHPSHTRRSLLNETGICPASTESSTHLVLEGESLDAVVKRAMKVTTWSVAQPTRVVSLNGKYEASRFQPVPGTWEPWYWTLVELETDKVLTARWECPHCGRQFHGRGVCEEHCKGKIGSFGPTCPKMNPIRGGKVNER